MFVLDTAASVAEETDFVAAVEEISNGLNSSFHIPKIFVTVAIAILILLVARILCYIIKRTLKKIANRGLKFTMIMAQLVSKFCSALIWIIAIVAVLGIFGIDLTPVLAGLGITGVVLGFALQESISSLFSGVMIAINNPFRVGDWVDIGDISGTVVAMDLMCVTLSAGDNKKITMNNKNVWGNTIINYSYIDKRRLDMTVTVRYSDDLEKAKDTIRDLIAGYPEILKDPAPLVEIDYWKVYWRFNAEILKTLQANGIDMPFNQIDVHIINN